MDTNSKIIPYKSSTFSGTIFGFVVCIVIVYLIESIGHIIYPLPSPLNSNLSVDIVILKQYVENATLTVMLFPIFSYIFGAFFGGYIANHFTKKILPSFYVGLSLLISILIALKTIPHPLWYVFVSCSIPIALALVGGYISKSTSAKFNY